MEALELRNRQLVEYIEGLERDLAGRMSEQVRISVGCLYVKAQWWYSS